MSNYLISISKSETLNDGIIHDIPSKLKVKVFNLLGSTFIPCKGEISFFVTAGKETLAFETRGYKKHRKLLVLQMISWYCIYLNLIEAQIHSHCPY
ncbi:MAG: hypothetical protein JWR67_1422 [Mucilaginibacter sp.]|nr:hypothetical protein [Mucilaginibacter sp.]